MEDPPGVIRPPARGAGDRFVAALGSGLAVLALLAGVVAGPAAPAGDISPAPGNAGAAGMLWGRVAVEEESPDGPWTPLVGVEVRLYPYTPTVAADLDQIRERARDSGVVYEAAVNRLLDRLKRYEREVAGPATASASSGPSPVVTRTTDSSGVFVFDPLAPGDWLVVVVYLAPYARETQEAPRPHRPAGKGRDSAFLQHPSGVAKEADVWVTRVRVDPGARERLLLTDRSRFMSGPARSATSPPGVPR